MPHNPDNPRSWERESGGKKGGNGGGLPVKAGEMVLFSTLSWAQQPVG